jgi:hypothetical protein
MLREQVASENTRRLSLWDGLIAADGPNGSAPLLREFGIYVGAQGIWVDKRITGSLTPDGSGIAVGLLHSSSALTTTSLKTGSFITSESQNGLVVEMPRRRQQFEICSNSVFLPL